MPVSLRFWEWGCPKRKDAHITVTPGVLHWFYYQDVRLNLRDSGPVPHKINKFATLFNTDNKIGILKESCPCGQPQSFPGVHMTGQKRLPGGDWERRIHYSASYMCITTAADQLLFWKMELNHGGAVVREEYQEIRSVFNNRDHSGISAVIFDPLEELVWTGNQSVGLKRIDRKFGVVIMISVILINWAYLISCKKLC